MSTATEQSGARTGPAAPDPVAAGAALARDCEARSAPYVLYERDGEVLFAAGVRAEIVLDRSGLHVHSGGRTRTEALTDRPLDQVAAALAAHGEPGWRAYGWAAFELGHLLHGLPTPDRTGALLHLLLPDREARLGDGPPQLRVADPAARAAWEATLAAPPVPAGAAVAVDEVTDTTGYRSAVAAAVREIHEARFRKVILSRTVPVDGAVDLVATYEAGRRGNNPARSFLLRLGGLAAAGFSPETVVEVAADGTFSTQPLAGTRALSGDRETDSALHEELRNDPKEIYEHAVSVQLAQDEVAAVSVPGSVVVEDFMRVVLRGSVQHLASRVRGRLRPGVSSWDAFARLFPSVTASGLPKAPAFAAIGRHEDGPRGLYAGAVLTVDHAGALDAALVLRSVYQRDGLTWLRAGAGIVAQSSPERELEETREKLRSVSRFLVGPGPVVTA
ncbi:salicylate synthase [Pseudonocardia sp. MH-G8]|uniref:salicylate synthase n=1 Tax=Pseudonocardia sp. MH-G8 TaxID=1854588 RepID=UPI000BA0CD87|nr:salicylate synthase [Pseudonocardia sp. MH-G8]OZM78697.1 salicylate synthase [Pseudonocardia sp. MH-G8]